MYFETERMILRDYTRADKELYYKLKSDKDTMYYLQDIQTLSKEEAEVDFTNVINDMENDTRQYYFFHMELKGTHEQIGSIGYTVTDITPVGKLVHLGYFSYPKFWNQGYTTEALREVLRFAFEENDVYRVTTGCLAENVGSEKVMKKCGLIKEVEHVDYEWHDGKMKTRLEYRLLRKEYLNLCRIRPISTENIPDVVHAIRESFGTVAREFGFTEENAPGFTAFATDECRVNWQLSEEHRPMYGYFAEGKLIGYYSLLVKDGGACELNNLCVLPEYRHKRIGDELLKDSFERARNIGCVKMNIGIVEENQVLRKWYEQYGFIHTGTEKFDFFPFTCGYLEKDLLKKVILLNGASSSGKSTIAHNLQELLKSIKDERYEVVSIDDFLKMDKDEPIYEDDVYEIMPDMCETIKKQLSICDGVIIDHVITSERIYDILLNELDNYEVCTVKVTCSDKVLNEREISRGNRCVGSASASNAYLYPKGEYTFGVDTTETTGEECAKYIMERFFGSQNYYMEGDPL